MRAHVIENDALVPTYDDTQRFVGVLQLALDGSFHAVVVDYGLRKPNWRARSYRLSAPMEPGMPPPGVVHVAFGDTITVKGDVYEIGGCDSTGALRLTRLGSTIETKP